MKLWMLAAILICGSSVFMSCSSNDDAPKQSEKNLAETLVGKWLYIEADGEVVETEESSITTYVMEGSSRNTTCGPASSRPR